jgi:hypothetical protein
MEIALAEKYAKSAQQTIKNKQFAENLRKKHNIRSLKINKRYCQDTITGKEFYYTLPCETFQKALTECLKNGNF